VPRTRATPRIDADGQQPVVTDGAKGIFVDVVVADVTWIVGIIP
jgi:hypothetical protein